jgi:hypothetical protein
MKKYGSDIICHSLLQTENLYFIAERRRYALKKSISRYERTSAQKTAISNYFNKYQSPGRVTTHERRRNSMKKNILKVSVLVLILFLGLTMVVVYGQEPDEVQLSEEATVQGEVGTQAELGASGIGDDLAGYELLYMFSGVRNEITDPEFATVVHCTNYNPGGGGVEVVVQFFETNAGSTSLTAADTISPDDTATFSTQSIGSFSNEIYELFEDIDIEHGSGRVMVTEGTEATVICTAQVLALDGSDVPADTTKLHLFDSEGNLIDNDPGTTAQDGIFMPIIFKKG